MQPSRQTQPQDSEAQKPGTRRRFLTQIALFGAAIGAVPAMLWYKQRPDDPPGEIENPRLVTMFNRAIDQVLADLGPPKHMGQLPSAKDAARRFFGSIRSVVQYSKYREKQHPNIPNGFHFWVVFSDGVVLDDPQSRNNRAVTATGVRLQFVDGRVVSAKTNGAELDLPPEHVAAMARSTVESLLAIDLRRNWSGYFKPYVVPTAQDNRKVWAER